MRVASLLAATAVLVAALPAFATVALPSPEAASLPDIFVDRALPPAETAAMPDIFVNRALPPGETASLPDIIVDRAPRPPVDVASAVPDAATWALMLTGLLAVGAVLRRRKSVVLA